MSSRTAVVLRPFEAAFVIIAMGFVTHEVVGEVDWLETYFHCVPVWFSSKIPDLAFGWIEAGWFLLVVPAILWTTIGVGAYALRYKGSLRDLLLTATTAAAPLLAIAHVAKALAKATSWAGFLPMAIHSPSGIAMAAAIRAGRTRAPASLLHLPLLGWLLLFVLVAFLWTVLNRSRGSASAAPAPARAAILVAAALFSTVFVIWTCV